jgi:hypothetical protein
LGEATKVFAVPAARLRRETAARTQEPTSMNDLERTLTEITPRAATVTLLLFDKVVERYENESNRTLSPSERALIVSILRRVVASDTRVG